MAILRYIILLIPLLTFGSCYREISPDIAGAPVLCINSLMTAGEPMEVSVTHTWPYTEINPDISVDDAEVRIYADGAAVGDDYLPMEGDMIRICAVSRKFGYAGAEVTVPAAVPVEELTFIPRLKDSFIRQDGDTIELYCSFDMNIRFNVTDSDVSDNYYHYDCSIYTRDGNPYRVNLDHGTLRYDAEPIFSEHMENLESLTGTDGWGFSFFTDRQFSGRSYRLNICYTDASVTVRFAAGKPYVIPDCGFVIILGSVSEGYYNMANYNWQVTSGLTGDFGDAGLGDAIWGYSNVSSGAGVVAAQSLSTATVSLRDWLTSLYERFASR